jgi:ParB-like chromosome segregation protein Spo0J
MPRTREENARLDRLAGSGEGWGGGLPLPLLFAAILNEILDYGSASHERLTEIASTELAFKTSQVMSVWESWEDFTTDVLAQMEARRILASDGYTWTAGDKLATDTYLEVIPSRAWKGRKYPADGVTVWDKQERERRSRESHAEHEATSLVGNFRDAAPDHVSEIRQSVAQVGQLYPVLVDQHGRILDGGHRKAADPNWPERRMTVRSEQEALAIGLWANRGKPLAPKVQARVTELIGELAGTSQLKRERAEAALLADPSRSNRDIGREVGCSDNTVRDVRRELEETAQIAQFTASGGRGVTTGTITDTRPRVLTDEKQAEVDALVASGATRAAVVEQTGLKENTAQRAMEKARERIKRTPEPQSSPIAEEEAEHIHDWGPWIRIRQCVECGEQEIEE